MLARCWWIGCLFALLHPCMWLIRSTRVSSLDNSTMMMVDGSDVATFSSNPIQLINEERKRGTEFALLKAGGFGGIYCSCTSSSMISLFRQISKGKLEKDYRLAFWLPFSREWYGATIACMQHHCMRASSIQKWMHEKARLELTEKKYYYTWQTRQTSYHILRLKVRTTNDPYQKNIKLVPQAIHYTTQEQTRPHSLPESTSISQTNYAKKKHLEMEQRMQSTNHTLCNKYQGCSTSFSLL